MRAVYAISLVASLCSHALGLRSVDEELDATITDEEGTEAGVAAVDFAAASDEDKAKAFEKAVQAGAQFQSDASCAELGANIKETFDLIETSMTELFTEKFAEQANVSKELENTIFASSETFIGLASIADDKGCLVEVMSTPGLQEGLGRVLTQHLSELFMEPEEQRHLAACPVPAEDFSQRGYVGFGDYPEKFRRHWGIKHDTFEEAWSACGWVPSCNCVVKADDGFYYQKKACTTHAEGFTGEKAIFFMNYTCSKWNRMGAKGLRGAWKALVGWMHGTADLAPQLAEQDNKLLFPVDVDKQENCPAPCGECSREHNSWRKGEELFKFKCLLQRGQEAPQRAGLDCTAPRRRRSFWRPHRYGRKSWCTVRDWQQAVCHKMRVSAVIACGTTAIIGALKSGNPIQTYYYELCVKKELWQKGTGSYRRDRKHDWEEKSYIFEMDPPPQRNQFAFNLVMSLGIANGMAALRDRAAVEPKEKADAFLAVFVPSKYGLEQDVRAFFNSSETIGQDCSFLQSVDECRPVWKARVKNVLHRCVVIMQNALWFTLYVGIAAALSIPFMMGTAAFLALLGLLFGPGAGLVVHPISLTLIALTGAFFTTMLTWSLLKWPPLPGWGLYKFQAPCDPEAPLDEDWGKAIRDVVRRNEDEE